MEGTEDSDDKDGTDQATCTDSPPSSVEESSPSPKRPPRKKSFVSRITDAARNQGGHTISIARKGSDTTAQCSQVAAMRRRDLFPKRRHHSTSSLGANNSSQMIGEKSSPVTGKSYRSFNQPRSLDSFEHAIRVSTVKSSFDKTKSLDDTKRIALSNSSRRSSQSSPYEEFDIIGETFEARFPWQKDVSTQCTIPSIPSGNACCEQSSPVSSESRTPEASKKSTHSSILRKRRKLRNSRPHSIGCTEDTAHQYDILEQKESDRRKARKSEPFVHRQTNFSRKRMSLNEQDDPGSMSDLESILEDPDDGSQFDVSRENSIVSDEETVSICNELKRLVVNGSTRDGYVDVLPSPRMSPDLWHNVPDLLVTSESEDTSDSQIDKKQGNHKCRNLLSVPAKHPRRRSSGSLTSCSDESDCEPSPPLSRRGRRAAIVDTKNFGDVSPTTLSPDVSPSNSCDEGDGATNIAERLRRRRSSVDLAMNIYPGDLLVQDHHKKLIKRNTIADFYAARNGSSASLADESKKVRQPFSLLKLMKTRSKESLSHLEDILAKFKPSEFKDNHLAAYKSLHWSDVIASSDRNTKKPSISQLERKRREAVWELFRSECTFLIDHLMVIKHCFMEPLKKVQVEGFLMYAEPQDLFGNLDELCYVSYTFCKDFISALLKDMSSTDFGRTKILIRAFQRFSTHSKDGAVYHTYCLNYMNAITYLESLRRKDEFSEFEKFCEQDPRCNRLQLPDLLVAPMQHCTKLPLLLSNIRRYTEDESECHQLTESIQKVETSLQQLEDKMKWVKNYERVQEIQRHLVWPPVADLDTRIFIPEFLKSRLQKQPCERLLTCPKRQLIHEGQLSLVESAKTMDVYLFLFDDILLVTKMKKSLRKKQSVNDLNHIKMNPTVPSDKTSYTVYRQPVALDRFSLYDVSPSEAANNGVKNAFVIVQISRFQQIIGVYTLQAPNEQTKVMWMIHIKEAKEKYSKTQNSRQNSFKENKDPKKDDQDAGDGPICSSSRRSSAQRPGVLKLSHGKSLSMDAVFMT